MADPVILIVDDELQVRNAVERDLRQKYGVDYRIIKAGSGAEALDAARQLKERNAPVALFLVDQLMPGPTLTVDDEPQVLNAVERDLRQKYGVEYRIIKVGSGTEALDVLRQLKSNLVQHPYSLGHGSGPGSCAGRRLLSGVPPVAEQAVGTSDVGPSCFQAALQALRQNARWPLAGSAY